MRFDGINIISLPTTEIWFGWGMLLLVVLFGLITTTAPGFIRERFQVMFAEPNRRTFSSMTTQTNSNTLLWSSLFTLLSLTMSLYVCLPTESGYDLLRFGLFSGSFLLMLCLRILSIWFLCTIFGRHGSFSALLGQYSRILFATAVCSCALLFVYLVLPAGVRAHRWVFMPAAVVYGFLLLWHFYRIFPINLYRVVYLALYLLAVEVLPMVTLVNNYNKLMI